MQQDEAQPQPTPSHEEDKSRSYSVNGREEPDQSQEKYRKLRLRFDTLKQVSIINTISYSQLLIYKYYPYAQVGQSSTKFEKEQ